MSLRRTRLKVKSPETPARRFPLPAIEPGREKPRRTISPILKYYHPLKPTRHDTPAGVAGREAMQSSPPRRRVALDSSGAPKGADMLLKLNARQHTFNADLCKADWMLCAARQLAAGGRLPGPLEVHRPYDRPC